MIDMIRMLDTLRYALGYQKWPNLLRLHLSKEYT